ncbi:MAG: flagellin lysine-N-methylase [Selenomonadaceae bacterium]|nr:flagellin lysine-N-methylase [Selenomonadaceae bacterium]
MNLELKIIKCIQPAYVKDFKCNGKFCDCRCCRDWKILLDDDTYKKFLTLNEVDRAEILKNVNHSRDKNFGVDVMTLKLDDAGRCSFLTADGLCSIQKRHGEDFLTAICQSYPRVTYKLSENIFEQSMTLTCPVAAQMILFSEEPIKFVEVDEVKTRAIIDIKISRNVEDFINLQMDAIKILQDRNFSINRRLKKFYEMFGGKISYDVEFNLKSHALTLIDIFNKMYGAELNATKEDELRKSYAVCKEKILSAVYENFSYVLENYLVNEFFMRCYPQAFGGGDLLNCKIFLTSYRLIEFALVLTVIAKPRFNLDDMSNLIVSVNDMLDHSHGGMDAIIDFAKSCDEKTFASTMLDI